MIFIQRYILHLLLCVPLSCNQIRYSNLVHVKQCREVLIVTSSEVYAVTWSLDIYNACISCVSRVILQVLQRITVMYVLTVNTTMGWAMFLILRTAMHIFRCVSCASVSINSTCSKLSYISIRRLSIKS